MNDKVRDRQYPDRRADARPRQRPRSHRTTIEITLRQTKIRRVRPTIIRVRRRDALIKRFHPRQRGRVAESILVSSRQFRLTRRVPLRGPERLRLRVRARRAPSRERIPVTRRHRGHVLPVREITGEDAHR